MTDVVDATTRSRMMSGIRAKNTSPEVIVRKALHARGFRFRIHLRGLPGKPDLVFSKYKAVVFVHGCFWHGHSCRYFKAPKSRADFWLAKISNNKKRDTLQVSSLLSKGWRVLVIWECAIRAVKGNDDSLLFDNVSEWLLQGSSYNEIEEGDLNMGCYR